MNINLKFFVSVAILVSSLIQVPVVAKSDKQKEFSLDSICTIESIAKQYLNKPIKVSGKLILGPHNYSWFEAPSCKSKKLFVHLKCNPESNCKHDEISQKSKKNITYGEVNISLIGKIKYYQNEKNYELQVTQVLEVK